MVLRAKIKYLNMLNFFPWRMCNHTTVRCFVIVCFLLGAYFLIHRSFWWQKKFDCFDGVMWKLMNPIDYRKAMEPSESLYIIAWRRNVEEKNNSSLCKLLHLTFLSSFDFVAFFVQTENRQRRTFSINLWSKY